MTTLVLTAENYAFGPSGKLLTIASLLHKKGYRLIFIGNGTAYQLCSKFPFYKKYKRDTSSNSFKELAKKVFPQAKMLISAMDKPSICVAQALGLPVALIDSLFWYWYEIPDYLWSVELYFKQRSLKDVRNTQKYAHQIPNLISVGPIIDEIGILEQSEKQNQLLISFGGMEAKNWYKVGIDSHYPFVLTDLILNDLDLNRFKRILITGNEQIINQLAQKYKMVKSNILFVSLSHEQFLTELARSSCLLCAPGLETTLESFFYQVPVIFLPPSNSSQYMQLDEFRANKIASLSVHFSDYYRQLHLTEYDSHERMFKFLTQLRVFERDIKAKRSMANRLSLFLKDKSSLKKQVNIQKKFLESIGGNCTETVVNYIQKYLDKV